MVVRSGGLQGVPARGISDQVAPQNPESACVPAQRAWWQFQPSDQQLHMQQVSSPVGDTADPLDQLGVSQPGSKKLPLWAESWGGNITELLQDMVVKGPPRTLHFWGCSYNFIHFKMYFLNTFEMYFTNSHIHGLGCLQTVNH